VANTSTNPKSTSRQRLAWLILLLSIFACVVLTAGVPLAISSYLSNSTRSLAVRVLANEGTVGLLEDGVGSPALFPGDPARDVESGAEILTDSSDTAVIDFADPEGGQLFARLQVYGNSNLQLQRASTARFSSGSVGTSVQLLLAQGRIRASIPEDLPGNFSMEIRTQRGSVQLSHPGIYSIEAGTSSTELAVLEGEAELIGTSEFITLQADQRATVGPDGEPAGPFAAERNLMRSGSFGDDFAEYWVSLSPNVELEGQASPAITLRDAGTGRGLHISRTGTGHADVSVRQSVGRDVSDYSELRLVISLRVMSQSLGVCGEIGSECPLTIMIDFEDIHGNERTWRQGFYSSGTLGRLSPSICTTCVPPINEHARVPFQQPAFYDSGNLLESLATQNMLPRSISSLQLMAAGHTFDIEVTNISLLATE